MQKTVFCKRFLFANKAHNIKCLREKEKKHNEITDQNVGNIQETSLVCIIYIHYMTIGKHVIWLKKSIFNYIIYYFYFFNNLIELITRPDLAVKDRWTCDKHKAEWQPWSADSTQHNFLFQEHFILWHFC